MTEVKDARDLETLAQLLGDPEEDDTVRHEIANLLSRSNYALLEACLVKIVDNPAEKERFRSWAVQHLGTLLLDENASGDRRALTERLRILLSDRHRYVQREALLALSRLDDAAVPDQVRDMLSDPAPDADPMRDFAIRIAYDYNRRELIPLIRPYAHSTNDIIRIAAIVALSQWGDEESRPAFEEAASSPGIRLQRAGTAALARLATAPASQPAP
jgi:HEAT repeat protein